jgi:hypothetical protein
MYIYIRNMKTKRIALHAKLPLLPGSLSTTQSTCGKPHCTCKAKPPKLHGPYHRWTGFIRGKRTTKTITPAQARQCKARIRNFRALQKQVDQLLAQAIQQAPWNELPTKPRR